MHNVLQPNYARRYHKLRAAVERHLLPLGVTTPSVDKSGAAGGYYMWLQLPEVVEVSEVIKVARDQYSLLIHPGSLFLVEGDSPSIQQSFLNGLRVCFVWVDEDLLAEGIERLAEVIAVLMARQRT